MNKKLPIYAAQVGDKDGTGIYAISFVESPAVERNFVALAKKAAPVKMNFNSHKQILTGVVLIPDQLIYRNDAMGEYYIKYSAQDIEKIAAEMMRAGVALQSTTHQHEKPLAGNYLVECWIVADPKRDKAVALGLGELPKGTLMASYKVTDAKYWKDEVLTGNVKGFSLEGLFNFNEITMKKTQVTQGRAKAAIKKPSKLSAFLATCAALLEGETEAAAEDLVDEAAKDETDSADPYLVFELADGGEVFVDADGFATLNGEQMPAGEHALADGNVIVIDDAGNLVITTDEPEAVEPDEAAVELAKQRAAQLLAKSKAPAKGKNAAKIAALEKQIAELKKTPSTGGKVVVKVEQNVDPSKLPFHKRAALAIASRQQRTAK